MRDMGEDTWERSKIQRCGSTVKEEGETRGGGGRGGKGKGGEG